MKFVIANWKAKMKNEEVLAWCNTWNTHFSEHVDTKVKVIVAPSTIHIPLMCQFNNITLCSQDASMHQMGSHTGEVTSQQLTEFVNYSIIGHSERKESYKVVQTKSNLCIQNNITPIVCFTKPTDAKKYLFNENIILAWEDPSNISKNGVLQPKDPNEIISEIHKIRGLVGNTKLLYGGSVSADNVSEYKSIIDGVLVGTSSLNPESFFEITRNIL